MCRIPCWGITKPKARRESFVHIAAKARELMNVKDAALRSQRLADLPLTKLWPPATEILLKSGARRNPHRFAAHDF
jgi:hypothetical protein